MADLNMWIGIGRLGKDPELRHFPNGDAVCNVSIAVGRKWKDKQSGEMKEQTTWVPCQFYGKSAELLAQYAKKGSQIRVNGEFSVRKYTDNSTQQEKWITEIKVQDFQLLGGKPDGAGAPAGAPAPARAPAPATRQQSMDDSDVPF